MAMPSMMGRRNAPYFVGEPGAIVERPMPAPRPALFPQGGVGRHIAGSIGDVLMQLGGLRPTYQPAMQLRQQQDMLQQQRQGNREDQRDEWLFRQQWERDNPAPQAPTEFDQQLDAAGITDPAQRQAAYADIVQNRREGSPFQFDVSGDGIPDLVPRSEYRRITQGGATAPTLAPGTVVNGMRFRGGDRRDRNSWEPVNQGGPQASRPAAGFP